MSFETAGYQLLPVLPELVLAVGAMLLLMAGAYRGTQATGLVTVLAVCLLAVVGALELWLPAGKLTTFGGSFIVDDFARFMKILSLIGSAATALDAATARCAERCSCASISSASAALGETSTPCSAMKASS